MPVLRRRLLSNNNERLSMKTFSVIVPVYNVEAYISATVQSILNQTDRDFELIIIDDGSPDLSAQIAERLLQSSDIDYQIIHTNNRGVSAARNSGLDAAHGEYVIMVDGDDSLSPDFLATYRKMKDCYPKADVYSTSFSILMGDRIIEQPGTGQSIASFSAKDALIAFFNRKPRFLLPTLLLSKDFLNRHHLRFDEEVRYSEDVQFIWRVLVYNEKNVIHSDYSGYKYILHPGSTMTSSGVAKILTWCKGFEALDKDIHELLPEEIRELFVPSGYLSMLHGAAKAASYPSFKVIYNEAGCAEQLRFPVGKVPFKVKLVSNLTRISPLVGYQIMKRF